MESLIWLTIHHHLLVAARKKKKDNHGLKLKLTLAEDSLSDHTFILFFLQINTTNQILLFSFN